MQSERSLKIDGIDVYRVDLDNEDWDQFAHVLSAEEKARCERFRTLELRQHFMRARVALRATLARYLSIEPHLLRLLTTEFGKPYLESGDLQFNLSHSASQALVGVSGHVIGIDLEYRLREGFDIAGLISMVCHVAETQVLMEMAEQERAEAFYQLWTRKEAYCKARGLGLQLSLSAIRFEAFRRCGVDADLSFEANHGWVKVMDERAVGPIYFVRDMQVDDDFAASICVDTDQAQISVRDLDPRSMTGI